MTDQELMYAIKQSYGVTIDDACSSSSIPAAFLAGLVGNESGGRSDAKRFEKGVLAALWEVLLGRKAAYGSIGRSDLVAYVARIPVNTINPPAVLPADAFQLLDSLATSWGLTQIMGYHIFEFGTSIEALKTPAGNLQVAVKLLAQFVERNQLDVRDAKELGELFDCWNTGRPDGVTFDPNYVTNGLARMELYGSLA
jgi:hypothetical protein